MFLLVDAQQATWLAGMLTRRYDRVQRRSPWCVVGFLHERRVWFSEPPTWSSWRSLLDAGYRARIQLFSVTEGVAAVGSFYLQAPPFRAGDAYFVLNRTQGWGGFSR